MQQKSRIVESNQSGPHARLAEVVARHMTHPFRKPVAGHTQVVFETIAKRVAVDSRPIIFDACCGVGDSSRALAHMFPGHLIIGVDKSEHRLVRERDEAPLENLMLVRADLNDFYRLAYAAGWRFDRHYILYPNPWPKAEHLGRRWHGAPVFPALIGLGGRLELRSNWKIYLQEFQMALGLVGVQSDLSPYHPQSCITPFEQKYHQSGQPLWQLVCQP